MNGTLVMDSQGLGDLAASVLKSANELDSIKSSFYHDCDSITNPDVWAGDACNAFKSVVDEFKVKFDAAAELIQEASRDYTNTLNRYEETQNSNVNMINNAN